MQDNNVIVVYAKDGESLLSYKDGGTGSMRVIVRNDEFGNRSIKYLSEIQCVE